MDRFIVNIVVIVIETYSNSHIEIVALTHMEKHIVHMKVQ